MKKIAFVGGFDKLDLIQYVGIVYHNVKKKVLIVDTTRMQKSRYITPAIDNTQKQYITTTQGVDLAVGFKSYQDLKEEMGTDLDEYDFMFIDVDSYKVLETFELSADDMIFLTTTFDVFSLKIGLGVLSQFTEKTVINKILLARTLTPYHVQYVNQVCKKCNIQWGDISIFFPYDNGDLSIIHENQREYRMNLKKFSKDFLGSLLDLCVIIDPDNAKGIRKYIKIQSKN